MTPKTDEISWDAEIQVKVSPDSPDPHILLEEWRDALLQNGLEEMLLSDDPASHAEHNGFRVTFQFKFQQGKQPDRIIAQATCHPAWQYRGEVMTDISTTIGWAEIRIRLKDARALRVALQELGWGAA